MKIITNTIDFLKGKKAYIIGTLTIILGILNKNQDMILNGLGIITIRAGIAKSQNGTTLPN